MPKYLIYKYKPAVLNGWITQRKTVPVHHCVHRQPVNNVKLPHPLVINSSCLHSVSLPGTSNQLFFASLFDLNDASLGTSPSVLLTSWLHLFSPTCLPETPLKKWFPASVDVLIFGTVFFYLSYRVSEIVLWFAASTQSPVWERPL